MHDTGRHVGAEKSTKSESIQRFQLLCSTAHLFFSSPLHLGLEFVKVVGLGFEPSLSRCSLVFITTVSISTVFAGLQQFFSTVTLSCILHPQNTI